MNENCRHSSVACERSDIAMFQTRHTKSFFGTANVAVKFTINKERSVFQFHVSTLHLLYFKARKILLNCCHDPRVLIDMLHVTEQSVVRES